MWSLKCKLALSVNCVNFPISFHQTVAPRPQSYAAADNVCLASRNVSCDCLFTLHSTFSPASVPDMLLTEMLSAAALPALLQSCRNCERVFLFSAMSPSLGPFCFANDVDILQGSQVGCKLFPSNTKLFRCSIVTES